MNLFIAEKPSVAKEFAKALDMKGSHTDGYIEDGDNIVTWCVGHLIEMSMPEAYDEKYGHWSSDDLPFIPENGKYKYEVIKDVRKQYDVVKSLLNRKDVTDIYYSGDSAREGEYIQRLVRKMAGHNPSAHEKRVWIDSQTREEILNGIRNAKDLSYYDTLSASAYARAKEDYLVGINFTRMLSLKYGNLVGQASGQKYTTISVGRVMSCVLGMVVERERLIRNTKVIPFYGIRADFGDGLSADWKITKDSAFANDPNNYKDTGLLVKTPVEELIKKLSTSGTLAVTKKEKSEARKSAPLLFNLAELQGECTRLFHISPADTLQTAQTLYEKKLTTYPRTDARVLTTAITKVYQNNIRGIEKFAPVKDIAEKVLTNGWEKRLRDTTTKYVDDSKVSDHYAIIPTGEGFENLASLNPMDRQIYELICRRFLSIFYPDAVYDRLNMEYKGEGETFTASYSALKNKGWLEAAGSESEGDRDALLLAEKQEGNIQADFSVKEGKSQPPKRYTTGSMILAMENAGKLIEDPELREQIKSSGIGTSATRADCITKLEKNKYIKVNKKTQQITPEVTGEVIYDVLMETVPVILKPAYTASWEKGLQQIVDGKIKEEDYLEKIYDYIRHIVSSIKEAEKQKLDENNQLIPTATDKIKNDIKKLQSVYPEIGQVKSGSQETGLSCPYCGKPLRTNQYGISCSDFKNCTFGIWNTVGGMKKGDKLVNRKKIPDSVLLDMAKTFMKGNDGTYSSQESRLVKGITSKTGKLFDAKLVLIGDGKTKPKIQYVFENKK